MRKSGKSMLVFGCQKHRFLFLGPLLQNQLHLIFYTFLLIKKICAVHFEKYIFFYEHFFHFFTLFSLRFIWTQSVFGANKKAFKHCTPPIMVLLASFTAPGSILIRIWRQNMFIWGQELRIPKYSHFYHSFLTLFLHFFSITCCKWIF